MKKRFSEDDIILYFELFVNLKHFGFEQYEFLNETKR